MEINCSMKLQVIYIYVDTKYLTKFVYTGNLQFYILYDHLLVHTINYSAKCSLFIKGDKMLPKRHLYIQETPCTINSNIRLERPYKTMNI